MPRKRFNYSVKVIFSLFAAFFIVSCQTKTPPPPTRAGYSKAFLPILDKTAVLFDVGKWNEGLDYVDSSARLIRNLNINDRFRVLGFHYLYWRKFKHDNKKALLYADTMLVLAKKSANAHDYQSNYVEANMAAGDAYFAMRKYNDAYTHYFEGFRIGKNYLNNGALSDYSYRMGMILYKMGHYQLAAGYFKESFRLNAPTRDPFADFYRNQEVLDNIALSYKHAGDLDSAMFYFMRTLNYVNQYAPRFKDKAGMMDMARGVVYGNEAEVLIAKGNMPEAAGLLKKSIEINLKKGNDNTDAELAEIKLADIYYNSGQNELLAGLLASLRSQLDSVKNPDAEADWNRLMSGYYLRKNDYKKSRDYLQNYLSQRDSINKGLNLLKESDVNQQLDSFEKQYVIDSLKGNNKVQQEYLYAAVACTLMALIIIFLVYRNWVRSKRDIRIVNELNRQIGNQKTDLEQTLNELKNSMLEKDRILRTVAHDLRNPIGGIAALTQAMEDDEFNAEQKEAIDIIGETANDTLELINEILEVTDSGKSKTKKELVDINALVSKSVELLRFKAAEKNQRIEMQLLTEPDEILISREKIWRVLSNLITNAIKFSPRNALIQVLVKDLKNEVEISVKDNGIGVPKDMLEEIFNTFTEAKRPGTAGEKSFGLGLSISKQIVENHNGKIWVESGPGAGSTFYIRLPKPSQGKSTPSKSQQTNVLTT